MSYTTVQPRSFPWPSIRVDVAWWGWVAAACAMLLMPLLLVEVPPVLDYPNHLARLWILSLGGSDEVIGRMIEARWALLPNLGIDVMVPPLIRLLGVHVAGRLMLGAILLVLFAGCLAYSRAVLGHRTPWALASALVVCNGAFLLGFLNFNLGIGLALVFAAHWVRNRDRRPIVALAVAIPAGVVLFFCHLMGVFFYVLLIASREGTVAWDEAPGRVAAVIRRALVASAVMIVPAVLYVASPLGGHDGPPRWEWADKPVRALFPLFGYDPWLDLSTGVMVLALLAVLAARRRLHVPRATLLAGSVLALLYCVAPFGGKGVCFFDIRFVVMLWLLLFAALTPVRLNARWRMAMMACLGAMFVARIGVVATVWHDYAPALAQLRWTIAPVAPGQRVLVVGIFPGDDPAFYRRGPHSAWMVDNTPTNAHRTALVMVEQRAFWSPLFANPTQQPLRYLNEYAPLAGPAELIALPGMLSVSGLSDEHKLRFPLWDRWWTTFDWVLLQDPAAVEDYSAFGGGHLDLVRRTDAAVLFRVRPGPAVPLASVAGTADVALP